MFCTEKNNNHTEHSSKCKIKNSCSFRHVCKFSLPLFLLCVLLTVGLMCCVVCLDSVKMLRAVPEAQCVSWRDYEARGYASGAAHCALYVATDPGIRLVRTDPPRTKYERLHVPADNLAAVG